MRQRPGLGPKPPQRKEVKTMPGLNQKGPEGRGAMTGRRQGVCTGAAGQRGQRGRRCPRGIGRGFGQEAGPRYGAGYETGFGTGDPTGPAPYTTTRTSLEERARILEEELQRVNDQLNAVSDPE